MEDKGAEMGRVRGLAISVEEESMNGVDFTVLKVAGIGLALVRDSRTVKGAKVLCTPLGNVRLDPMTGKPLGNDDKVVAQPVLDAKVFEAAQAGIEHEPFREE